MPAPSRIAARMALVALVAALAIQSAAEMDIGDLDAQLLTQELPPDAFLDQDFKAWLGKKSAG